MDSHFQRLVTEPNYYLDDANFLTINCIKEKQYPLDHVLTRDDKEAIREENKDKNVNFSYVCLMNEMFHYPNLTVRSLITGWGGVRVFKV